MRTLLVCLLLSLSAACGAQVEPLDNPRAPSGGSYDAGPASPSGEAPGGGPVPCAAADCNDPNLDEDYVDPGPDGQTSAKSRASTASVSPIQ